MRLSVIWSDLIGIHHLYALMSDCFIKMLLQRFYKRS